MPGVPVPKPEEANASHATLVESVEEPERGTPEAELPKKMANTSARSSTDASPRQSTPPTSVDGFLVDSDASKQLRRSRSVRQCSSLSTLTSDEPVVASRAKARNLDSESEQISGSRAVSGATLVEEDREKQERLKRSLNINMAWDQIEEPSQVEDDESKSRRRSRRSMIGSASGTAREAVANSATSLGKRLHGAIDAVKDKASAVTTRTTRSQAPIETPPKKLKVEETGIRRKFPNLKLPPKPAEKPAEPETEENVEPSKPTRPARLQKIYQEMGLYAGQTRSFDPRAPAKSNKKKRSSGATLAEVEKENSVLPLPIFGTYQRLTIEDAWEDYKLPFDILNPLKKEYKPKTWSNLGKNRFVGDAEATWDRKEHIRLGQSFCGCNEKTGCDEHCFNRSMSYECNELLCKLGPTCGNRPFEELRFRHKNKNFARLRPGEKESSNLYGDGVEVFKTADRGDGVRAMRSFEPGQIVIEYCGEIITQEEADRRMNEDYKERKDYYLMEFEDGLIIDAGTKGSVCRFVNHSCEPNCHVEKWKVDGEPRMALFAGPHGIMSGEELTYDYNFELFSQDSKQVCRCGAPTCRGVLGPKPKDKRASKIMNAVHSAKDTLIGIAKGAKRKAPESVAPNDVVGDSCSIQAKKKVRVDPVGVIQSFAKSIGRTMSHDAVPKGDPSLTQLQNDSRRQRAEARRAAEQKAEEDKAAATVLELAAAANDGEDSELDDPSPRKSTRHKRSVTLDVPVSAITYSRSEVPRLTSTTLKRSKSSPTKALADAKSRLAGKAKSVLHATTGGGSASSPRITSQSRLLGFSDASSPNDGKAMKQSRLSFGGGGFGFKSSPKKRDVDGEDQDADAGAVVGAAGDPKYPARSSSKKVPKLNGVSKLGKSALRIAATAKAGLQGEKGVGRKVRAVSGTAK